jgi:hypothetical protein
VRARDAWGNVSPPGTASAVTTPSATPALFADGFESGNLSKWNVSSTLPVQTATVHTGSYAAGGSTTAGNLFAAKTMSSTYPDAYARTWFTITAQSSQVNLLRLRVGTASVATVYVSSTNAKLGVATTTPGSGTTVSTTSGTTVSSGWHSVELHATTADTASMVEVWLDGVRVPGLTLTGLDLGTTGMSGLAIGDGGSIGAYTVYYDDVAFGTSRRGIVPDSTAP